MIMTESGSWLERAENFSPNFSLVDIFQIRVHFSNFELIKPVQVFLQSIPLDCRVHEGDRVLHSIEMH